MNLQTEKQPEQIQQMYNLEEEQTTLEDLVTDTYEIFISINSDDTMVDHLNV